MRVHLAYADQNEEFGRAFPLNGMDGTAVRRLTLSDWGDDWYLVELERTFEYKGTPHDCTIACWFVRVGSASRLAGMQ